MRNLIAPAVLAFSLVAGSAAFAATPAPAAKPAAVAKADMKAKRAACEKSWKEQKTHTGKQADFIKACVAKG